MRSLAEKLMRFIAQHVSIGPINNAVGGSPVAGMRCPRVRICGLCCRLNNRHRIRSCLYDYSYS